MSYTIGYNSHSGSLTCCRSRTFAWQHFKFGGNNTPVIRHSGSLTCCIFVATNPLKTTYMHRKNICENIGNSRNVMVVNMLVIIWLTFANILPSFKRYKMEQKKVTTLRDLDVSKIVTVLQVAERHGVSIRAVHHWMKKGFTIPGIESYEKLNPEFRTSPYVILANADFFNKRKKLTWETPVEEDEPDYLK